MAQSDHRGAESDQKVVPITIRQPRAQSHHEGHQSDHRWTESDQKGAESDRKWGQSQTRNGAQSDHIGAHIDNEYLGLGRCFHAHHAMLLPI